MDVAALTEQAYNSLFTHYVSTQHLIISYY